MSHKAKLIPALRRALKPTLRARIHDGYLLSLHLLSRYRRASLIYIYVHVYTYSNGATGALSPTCTKRDPAIRGDFFYFTLHLSVNNFDCLARVVFRRLRLPSREEHFPDDCPPVWRMRGAKRASRTGCLLSGMHPRFKRDSRLRVLLHNQFFDPIST